jgi:hypothetical protein
MKEIPLSQGQVALVDDEDYERLSLFRWSALWNVATRSFYAKRNSPRVNGSQRIVWMARDILGLQYGDSRQADHRLHNTLDNRRYVDGHQNLRIATAKQNTWNRRKPSSNKTGFKGVMATPYGRYRAFIWLNGKTKCLGSRRTPEEAYALYCAAAKEHFGDFAHF